MRSILMITAAMLVVAAPAFAHVTVSPRESRAGAGERYTVNVPTEGKVATVEIELEVPEGVLITGVQAGHAGTHEIKRTGDRISAIMWKLEIKPAEFAEFVFRARNPKAPQIAWRIHQRYADGTASHWVNEEGTRSPASITKLTDAAPMAASTPAAAGGAADAIKTWLAGYDQAFVAKNLDALAAFYHPDVTIYEGGGINRGWADYRDNHLGPELKAFENLQFAHSNLTVQMLSPDVAYVTSDYSIKASMKERTIDSGGLETLVVARQPNGEWRIRHSHTSSKPRRP